MLGKVAALAAAGMMLAGQAAAGDAVLAQVSDVKGAVVAGQYGKFSPIRNAARLRAGDRVLAKQGEASVRYADGCVVTLKPGGMATIGQSSPCVPGGDGLVTSANGSSAQLFADDFGVALVSWGFMLAIAAYLANEDDGNPASP